jgi:iron-sulfur cluster repair protein YtfE (RIC family)
MMNNSTEEDVLQRIQQEHRQLRELLGNVHQAFAQGEQRSADLIPLLHTLWSLVEEHFCEEEQGGFFKQVTDQAPGLANRAAAVRGEHAVLRDRVSRLCFEAALGGGGQPWWQHLEQQFHEFSKELMHHEGRENELLQEAYEQDIGPSD